MLFDRQIWFKKFLPTILLLALALMPLAGVGDLRAEADDNGRTYPIMHPDRETREKWIEAYNTAPLAYIDMEKFQVPSPRGSLDLLGHLEYTPTERNQADCGNCWAWAGTGCLEIALDVQEGVKDRLSMQYLNSNYNGGTGVGFACCGDWLSDLADFYQGTDIAIPWSNTNAHWQDGSQECGQSTTVPAGTISTTPNYPITSIDDVTIITQTVNQATAIANIKNVLHQNKGVWFGFFLPNSSAWSDLRNFWNNSAESAVYDMDKFCGIPYIPPPEGGGHAVLCVGYNDDDPGNTYWIMLNSWGTTTNRPNGLFRIDMNMDYGGKNPGMGDGDYSFYWQTLDVAFGGGGQPDITVSPTSFDVTLPQNTTQNYNLTIGNNGDDTLTYSISDRVTTGGGSQSSRPQMSRKQASMVLDFPTGGATVEPEETGDAPGWQTIMTEGFEGTFPGVWDVSAEVGYTDAYWGKDDYRSFAGSYSAYCAKSGTAGVNPPGPYPHDMEAGMIYGPFSLADATQAELSYNLWLDSEYDYDYLWIMASTDGSNYSGGGWSGYSDGWFPDFLDLADVNGTNFLGQPEVWIAFVFESDYMIGYEGAYVDDVVLEKYVAGVNNPPNTPSNPSPPNNATGVSVDTNLSWTGGDPDPEDTVTYDVYLDTTGATTLVSNDQSATTYDPPGSLSNNTKYYWKIVATDNNGASTPGPVWDFTTGVASVDCPWLDENPKSGSVAPAGSNSITVTINTAGLAVDTYNAEIVIANNDPDENPKIVPVTLHVTNGGVFTVCRHLPDTVQRGSTFDVSVTFPAPCDNFNSILITDVAPAGWTVEANTAWCTPAATFVNVPNGSVDITWFGPYPEGTAFTAVYKVTVPGDAPLGLHTFPNGTLRYYCGGVGPAYEDVVCDNQVEVAEDAIIRGITGEVRCDILTGVTIKLYKDSVLMNSTTSDGSGNYEITATETGDYTVVASKTGFRDETQSITIPNLELEYTLNFRGEHGLIPNAPDAAYAMDCVNHWLFPPSPECGLTAGTAMDVVNAWLFPVYPV